MLLCVADKETERDTTVSAKRRKDRTAEQRGRGPGFQESHLLGASHLLIAVLLPSAPTSRAWQLEKVRGRNWGSRWHIRMWLSHGRVAEQLEGGGNLQRNWCQAQARGDRGQFSGQLVLSPRDLPPASPSMSHAPPATGAWPVNTALTLVRVGVSGSCFGSSVWTSISREAVSPTLGALQRFLKSTSPSTAVTVETWRSLTFQRNYPWVTLVYFLIE